MPKNEQNEEQEILSYLRKVHAGKNPDPLGYQDLDSHVEESAQELEKYKINLKSGLSQEEVRQRRELASSIVMEIDGAAVVRTEATRTKP